MYLLSKSEKCINVRTNIFSIDEVQMLFDYNKTSFGYIHLIVDPYVDGVNGIEAGELPPDAKIHPRRVFITDDGVYAEHRFYKKVKDEYGNIKEVDSGKLYKVKKWIVKDERTKEKTIKVMREKKEQELYTTPKKYSNWINRWSVVPFITGGQCYEWKGTIFHDTDYVKHIDDNLIIFNNGLIVGSKQRCIVDPTKTWLDYVITCIKKRKFVLFAKTGVIVDE